MSLNQVITNIIDCMVITRPSNDDTQTVNDIRTQSVNPLAPQTGGNLNDVKIDYEPKVSEKYKQLIKNTNVIQ